MARSPISSCSRHAPARFLKTDPHGASRFAGWRGEQSHQRIRGLYHHWLAGFDGGSYFEVDRGRCSFVRREVFNHDLNLVGALDAGGKPHKRLSRPRAALERAHVEVLDHGEPSAGWSDIELEGQRTCAGVRAGGCPLNSLADFLRRRQRRSQGNYRYGGECLCAPHRQPEQTQQTSRTHSHGKLLLRGSKSKTTTLKATVHR